MLIFAKGIGRHFDSADTGGVAFKEELFHEFHDLVSVHLEGGLVSLGGEELVKTVERDHKLTNEATESVDTRW